MSTAPALVFRKDIWKNFPVHVIPLGSDETGAECHKIVWKRDQYSSTTLEQLITALKASDRWTVHVPLSPDAICTIRMKFRGVQPRSEDTFAKYTALPTLRTLDDLKMHYPVVWKEVPSERGNVYALTLHKRRLLDVIRRKKYDCFLETMESLYNALKMSTSWRILKSPYNEYICLLELC